MSRSHAEERSLTSESRNGTRRRKDGASSERATTPSELEEDERDEDGRFKNWPVAGTVCD